MKVPCNPEHWHITIVGSEIFRERPYNEAKASRKRPVAVLLLFIFAKKASSEFLASISATIKSII